MPHRSGNHPLPNTGVTVINAVPLASGVAEVCYQVAGIESFGVSAPAEEATPKKTNGTKKFIRVLIYI